MRNKADSTPTSTIDARADLDPVIRAVGVREVARRSGLSASAVSLWLSGGSDLRYENVRALAQAVQHEVRAVPSVPRKAK